MSLIRLGVIFGGRSVEHEVSVITAHQIMAALPQNEYQIVPIYIAKNGCWYTGEALKKLSNFENPEILIKSTDEVLLSMNINTPGLLSVPKPGGIFRKGGARYYPLDMAFPLMHGSNGEDGTLQGMLEMAQLPYVGPGVMAAAAAMDKAMTKTILRGKGLPVLDDLTLMRYQFQNDALGTLALVRHHFSGPIFVKPMSLGSSIGVSRAETNDELAESLSLAANYDEYILIEPAQDEIIEINCAVLGDGYSQQVSECEQPVSSAGLLSYEDKYMGGTKKGKGAKEGAKGGMASASRIIPAPIGRSLTERIQTTAQQAFKALGLSGVTRVDFLVDPKTETFYVNEVNPIPGSLSFYLWEPVGIDFPTLLARLIELGRERYQRRVNTTFSIDSWLLKTGVNLGSKLEMEEGNKE